MHEGREVELIDAIGQQLRGAIPPSALRITAKGGAGSDWAEVSFEFQDGAGGVGHFSFDDNPDEASAEICEALMELHEIMAGNGTGGWDRYSFTIDRDGKFDVSFSYEDA